MDAKKAYKAWKNSHKVNLCVYSDEQMFEIGYNFARDYIEDLEKEVDYLNKKLVGSLIEDRTELTEQVDALKNTVEVLANKKPKKVKVKTNE